MICKTKTDTIYIHITTTSNLIRVGTLVSLVSSPSILHSSILPLLAPLLLLTVSLERPNIFLCYLTNGGHEF